MTAVTVELTYDAIRVRINGVMHVNIKRSRLLGVQSWRFENNYSIEYTLAGGTVTSEYECEKTWRAVLSGLEKIL